MKSSQMYLVKVWCTGVVVAPVLSTILLIGHITRQHTAMEMILVIAFSIILGVLYLSPSLLIACFVLAKVFASNIQAVIGLIILITLQASLLYKYNLSLIYKAGDVPMWSYVAVFTIAAFVYKTKPATEI